VEKRGLKYPSAGGLARLCAEEIETLVEGELADPRIGLVSVTAVHIRTMAGRRRFGSTWKAMTRMRTKAWRVWKRRANNIRHELVERLHLRRAPELYFRLDRAENKKKPESRNCWRAPRRETRRARNPVEKRHSDLLEDVLRQIGRARTIRADLATPGPTAMQWDRRWPVARFCAPWASQADVVLHDGVPRVYRSLPFADAKWCSPATSMGNYEARLFWNAIAFTGPGWKV